MAIRIKQKDDHYEKIAREYVDERLQHIAFIMDGNGRWARKRGMVREYGHRFGAEAFKNITKYCVDIGIKTITVYAFSSENWKRPEKEVNAIMKLLDKYLDDCLADFSKYNVKVKFIGDMSAFEGPFMEKINKVQDVTASGEFTVNIALNYGARPELVNAFNKMINDGIRSADEQTISKYLYTSECPDPDLIIRTGGEYRLSNFLLWQAAYSELYFTDCLWPDITPEIVNEAIRAFYSRKRRYGGV